jgi:hypothetical protein
MPTTEELLLAISNAATAQTLAVAASKTSVDNLTDSYVDTKNKVDNELNNVDNTSDSSKPLSEADILALNLKVNISDLSTINGQSIVGGGPLVIARSLTELETLPYEDRGALRTPIPPLPSSDDSVIVEGIGLLIFVDSFTEPDDDETSFIAVDPVSLLPIGQWLLNLAAPDLADSWATDERHLRDELDEDEISRLSMFFTTK